jgi:hypothetical protein
MTGIPFGDQTNAIVWFDNGDHTLQIVSAGNPLPTTATLAGDVTIGDLAKANAANPSLSENGEYPLSLDLSGHLRVIDAGVVTAINLLLSLLLSILQILILLLLLMLLLLLLLPQLLR